LLADVADDLEGDLVRGGQLFGGPLRQVKIDFAGVLRQVDVAQANLALDLQRPGQVAVDRQLQVDPLA